MLDYHLVKVSFVLCALEVIDNVTVVVDPPLS
jgi:hypothetical protein